MARNYEDPEFPDEDDPAYQEEIFETMLEMNWTPDEVKEPALKKKYCAWLKARESGK